MSNVSITVKGHEELKKKFLARSINVGRATDAQMNTIVLLVEGNAVKLIRKRSNGRTYTRGNKTHVASAPNKAPNTDTGNLIRGIIHDVKKVPNKYVLGTVRSTAKYSLDLEYGTRRMKKRPFMRPALAGSAKQIKALLKKGIRGAL